MRRAMLAALLALTTVLTNVYAQGGGAWTLVGGGDGTLYVVADGVRHRVVALAQPDDQIEAIPLGDAWGYTFGGTTPAPDAAAPQAQPWHQVARWQGRGDKVTEPFTTSGAAWRLVYTVRDTRYSNPQLCIVANRLTDGRRVQGGCFHQDDTTYVYGGPGTFALDIKSSDEWTVAVEDGP